MISTNLNAMSAHTAWMNANANNVANVNTENYDASRTVLKAGPTAVKTRDEILGTLLDMKG
jgi:flagellar hook-associated protein FlgK